MVKQHSMSKQDTKTEHHSGYRIMKPRCQTHIFSFQLHPTMKRLATAELATRESTVPVSDINLTLGTSYIFAQVRLRSCTHLDDPGQFLHEVQFSSVYPEITTVYFVEIISGRLQESLISQEMIVPPLPPSSSLSYINIKISYIK